MTSSHEMRPALPATALLLFLLLGAPAARAEDGAAGDGAAGDEAAATAAETEVGNRSGGDTPPLVTQLPRRAEDRTLEALEALGEGWPNPYLSFLPVGAEPDMAYWQALGRMRAAERRERRRASTELPIEKGTVAETEPNDTRATADLLSTFGTGPGDDGSIDVTGDFGAVPDSPIGVPSGEDEGSIPLATETGLTTGSSILYSSSIGDGPHGSGGTGTGDLDFYRIPNVTTGQLIVVDIDTPMPFGDLDPFLALYDGAGNIVKLNEDEDSATTFDSFLAVSAPIDGDYFVSVAGSLFPFASVLSDPFDSSTGFGVGSEGSYLLTIRLEDGDADWFTFELEACDVLGVSLTGSGSQALLVDSDGELLAATAQDNSFVYPDASSLPGGGVVALSFVAPRTGTYSLRVLGTGGPGYALELRAFRPVSEGDPEPKTLFVDFDGATVDPAIFGGPPGDVALSPLSSFLGAWGLSPTDEDALIDRILEVVAENLALDPVAGPNPRFGVRLRNSRDHADPFGDPGVSRLIVGGTIGELGIPTIGIAQSIDPGDFESSESAVILLDLLSGSDFDPNSLNSFPLGPGASKLELVARSVGNIVAHEAGHYLGNFHTEQLNLFASIMDRGGNLPNTIGLGPDGVFGTEDDEDVDLVEDMFSDTEGFAGHEDTLAAVACGCSYDALLVFTDGFESGGTGNWAVGGF